MAYKYYNNTNSNKSLYLGSDLTKALGPTGAGLAIVGIAAGLGYGAWQYGGDISNALFGSGQQEIAGPLLTTNVTAETAGLLGSGGFASTVANWGSSLWSGVKSVADYVGPSVGKVAVAVAPVALTLAVSSSQQHSAIKAQEKAQAANIAAQAEHDKQVKAEADAAGVPEVIAKIADKLGIKPQNVVTTGAIGAGALILILLLTKRKRG